MSGKSIQAAQRRRGPQPSIGASHMFNGQPNQSHPSHPSHQYANQPPRKQSHAPPLPPPAAGSNMTKMSIPEAIMRITYRLTELESKDTTASTSTAVATSAPDATLIEDILARLELLENKEPTFGGSNGTDEIQSLKQMCETIKLTTLQQKNNVAREIAQLKSQIDSLKGLIGELTIKYEAFTQFTSQTENDLNDSIGDDETSSPSLKQLVEQALA